MPIWPASCAAAQWRGDRQEQQDAVLHLPLAHHSCALLLADGLAGHPAGAIASGLAIRAAARTLEAHYRHPDALALALHSANRAIAWHIRDYRAHRGMGTTLLMVLLKGQEAQWLNVGDANLWHLHHGQFDNLVSEQPSESSNRQEAKAGSVTAALCGLPIARSCQGQRLLQQGDRLMLATDGVSALGLSTLRACARQPSCKSVVSAVITALSQQAPAGDNASLIVAAPRRGRLGSVRRKSPLALPWPVAAKENAG
ncbi:PP2C family protein-serine/threonine phosphatase [Ferrimonas marina]|uniref:Serine/threonine protein phosphatase PrpC n=1 Tax=Ferrimonas marina TaxID=299255 RepID=A0A1M5VPQ9_9GAMM|nr:protein phosphatase 2C domain-containing protein [Ferrimonas marina]SHH77168.1 Serine/threonine protein phosphatase PrpC [Ferrimonas marina]